MIIAVTLMRVMQMTRDEIVHVVAVRNRPVATHVGVDMVIVVMTAVVVRRAAVGMTRIDRDPLRGGHTIKITTTTQPSETTSRP